VTLNKQESFNQDWQNQTSLNMHSFASIVNLKIYRSQCERKCYKADKSFTVFNLQILSFI